MRVCTKGVGMRICDKCGKEIEQHFESCWRCTHASVEMGAVASTEDSRSTPVIWAVLYRCLLAVSATLFAAVSWALNGPSWDVASVMRGIPLTVMILCGLVLFFSSFAVFTKQRGLAIWGFIVGGLCLSWMFPFLFR